MTDKFSWNRFFRFARAEQAGERREKLLQLGGFVAFCVVVYLICSLNEFGDNRDTEYGYIFSRFIVLIGLGFAIHINISNGFKRYFSEGRASQTFMLPVSKNEKFLYVAIKNIIITPSVLIGIVLLNDIMWINIMPDYHTNLIDSINHNPLSEFMLFYVFAIFGYALFFLGAVFFRRYQFLLTFCTWLIIFVLYASYTDGFYYGDRAYSIIIIISLFILLMMLAWRKYSTLQITK